MGSSATFRFHRVARLLDRTGESKRFGGGIPNLNAASLARFQAISGRGSWKHRIRRDRKNLHCNAAFPAEVSDAVARALFDATLGVEDRGDKDHRYMVQ